MKFSEFLYQKKSKKVIGLVLLIAFFTIIYSFLDSSHFQGMNPLQDKMKDNLVEKQIENDPTLETFQMVTTTQKKLEVKENVEEVVKEHEEKIGNPTLFQNFFDRFYFSTTTACLLGYGDVYPATNTLKFLSALQSFLTVILILY